MEPEPVEDDLGLSHNHGFRHAAVEADAQTQQPEEHGQIRMQRAEDSEEENDFRHKVGNKEDIDVPIGRITEPVILMKRPNADN
jgi:hypothetical protein